MTPFQRIRDNKEECDLLRAQLLELLAVILMAIKEQSTGKADRMVIPPDLRRHVGRFLK